MNEFLNLSFHTGFMSHSSGPYLILSRLSIGMVKTLVSAFPVARCRKVTATSARNSLTLAGISIRTPLLGAICTRRLG